jgi:hypothetical protein
MSTSETQVPTSIPEPEVDIGDTSGGLPSCHPRYSAEARHIGPTTEDQEKNDYGFTLITTECAAQL